MTLVIPKHNTILVPTMWPVFKNVTRNESQTCLYKYLLWIWMSISKVHECRTASILLTIILPRPSRIALIKKIYILNGQPWESVDHMFRVRPTHSQILMYINHKSTVMQHKCKDAYCCKHRKNNVQLII